MQHTTVALVSLGGEGCQGRLGAVLMMSLCLEHYLAQGWCLVGAVLPIGWPLTVKGPR